MADRYSESFSHDDIEAQLAAPIEDLIEAIGRSLPYEMLTPRSRQDLVRAGRRWMDENIDRLRVRVCPHREDLDSKARPTDAIAALADLIASLENIPPVVTVATLLYRYGIASLCAGYQPQGEV
jgi:hypothetical protein